MPGWLLQVLHWLSLPEFGLSTLFLVSLLSATLLPLGSEPALFGLVKLDPSLFWPGVAVATLGNTIGGMVDWWMGYGARGVADRVLQSKAHAKALAILDRLGPRACLLSWLPVVGDPLCAVAGWRRYPLLPCTVYMALGKLLRYLAMTGVLLWLFPGRFALPGP